MKFVVSVSGGLGSYEALRRTIDQKGRENTFGVFADVGRIVRDGETVCGEDDDLYRFLADIEQSLNFPILKIKSDRYTDIWDVFFKQRMLGSSMRDPCSRWMKRSVLNDWKRSHFGSINVITVLGLSWQESDRINEFTAIFGDACWFPCLEKPFITNEQIVADLATRGIDPPRIYGEGFTHNNCGGFCVKMGLYQCYLLWRRRIKRWMFAEEKELEFLAYLDRADISIYRRNDKNITMRQLRLLFEGGWIPKKRKQHSCASCMVPTELEILELMGANRPLL
jgi:hypothetical protein